MLIPPLIGALPLSSTASADMQQAGRHRVMNSPCKIVLKSSSQSPTSFQIPIFPVIAAVELGYFRDQGIHANAAIRLVAHVELVERNRDVLVVAYPGIAPF